MSEKGSVETVIMPDFQTGFGGFGHEYFCSSVGMHRSSFRANFGEQAENFVHL